MFSVPPPQATVRRLARLALVLAALSATLGVTVLSGWWLDMEPLKRVIRGAVAMMPNTAAGFVVAGAALGLALSTKPAFRRTATLASLVLVALALATLYQDLSHTALGIDRLLVDGARDPVAAGAPGRMSPVTAIAFALVGAAIVLLALRRLAATAQILSLTTAGISMVVLLGYLFELKAFYVSPPYTAMAYHTAAGVVILSMGILLGRPDAGVVRPLLGESTGAIVGRRLLPVALLLPVGIQALLVAGERLESLDSSLMMATASIVSSLFFLGLIWWTAHAVQQKESELREERNHFETTLGSIGDAVIVTDASQRITFMNAIAEALTGWRLDEVRGEPVATVFRIINEHTRLPVENPVDRVLRSGHIVGLANHTVLVDRHDEERPIDDTGAPIITPRGQIAGAVLVFRDISERRAQEKALKEADQRKDEFLAILGHELRNPLAPLTTGVELLRQAPQNPGIIGSVSEMMQRQLSHLVRLVDDLLDLSRISRGKIELRRSPLDLNEVLDAALELNHSLMEEKSLQVKVERWPEPLPIQGDFHRLTQVIGNLLSNAAKYNDPGGSVSVRLDVQGEHVVLSVVDTGYGIPPERIEGLFDMFSQVPEHRLRDGGGGGLGIGLALSRRIVSLHGGTITARSRGLGHGAEFRMRLPIARRQAAVPAAETAKDPEPPSARRVLVVDDNRDAADSLKTVLGIHGHTVEVCYGADEGLEAFDDFGPDVVLLDIGLPGMDGYEVARRIRQTEAGRHVMLIAITGWGQEEDRRRAEEAQFDHHFTKPVNTDQLNRLIA